MKQDNYPSNKYQDHLLEMYKLYVEMTDRISQRRSSANTWFLTINTALITAIGYFLSDGMASEVVLVCVAGVIGCFFWRRLVISYKQMNSVRFSVIHAIEEFLPLKIYKSEWIALGKGKNAKKYKPFTHIEEWIPVLFGSLYILMPVVFIFINSSYKQTFQIIFKS